MPNDTPTELGFQSFLVIEDDLLARNLLVQLLAGMGAKDIETADTGTQALAHLESTDRPPDLLLIDLTMPEMGGVTLMKKLADLKYSGAVVLVSGADELTLLVAEGLAKYRGVNVLGHITKPVTKESLSEFLASPGAGSTPSDTSG